MTLTRFAARVLLAAILPIHAVQAAQTAPTVITTPPGKAAPVPQNPVDPKETPEGIHQDAARDLTSGGFYNKPGATRAQYDAAWQRCRLIARGSATPGGVTVIPANVSPLAAGIGGGLGGLIGAAIAEGQQRRANRRSCLLIDGWRFVDDLPKDLVARIYMMTNEQREAWFDSMIGASEVPGKVGEPSTYGIPVDAGLHPETPLTAPGELTFARKEDPNLAFTLAPGEGAVVVAWRRLEPSAVGRTAGFDFARYDAKAGDLMYRPRDWKKQGDKTTYDLIVTSSDKKSPYEVRIVHLTAGDYVISNSQVGAVMGPQTNCFGAPTFHVGAGEILYLGDFIPYYNAKLSNGRTIYGLGYANHIEDARKVLAAKQADSAAALKLAEFRNGATYGCAGVLMTKWEIVGLPVAARRAPAAAPVVAPATTSASSAARRACAHRRGWHARAPVPVAMAVLSPLISAAPPPPPARTSGPPDSARWRAVPGARCRCAVAAACGSRTSPSAARSGSAPGRSETAGGTARSGCWRAGTRPRCRWARPPAPSGRQPGTPVLGRNRRRRRASRPSR